MNVEVLSHDFWKLQPQKLHKNVQGPFCQAGNFFLKFEKMASLPTHPSTRIQKAISTSEYDLIYQRQVQRLALIR